MGTLYIVATPIGNLQDITVRAAKLLTEIDIVACEDTRHTGMLLDHLRQTYLQHPEIAKKPKLISYYEENEEERLPYLLDILKSGQDIALVTDAGTPGIADPGFRVVRECKKEQIPVVALPGASSATLALVASGLPTDKYTFLGFLPRKDGNALKLLESLKKSQQEVQTTIIFFEAPHRLVRTLELIERIFGDISVVLARELTKVYEEIVQDKISFFTNKYRENLPKGEFVVLFHL